MTNQKISISETTTPRPLRNMSLHVASPTNPTPLLLDVVQAANYLGCSERYVRRLIHERRIPFVRLGGRKIRFATTDLESWVDEQRVPVRPARRRHRG